MKKYVSQRSVCTVVRYWNIQSHSIKSAFVLLDLTLPPNLCHECSKNVHSNESTYLLTWNKTLQFQGIMYAYKRKVRSACQCSIYWMETKLESKVRDTIWTKNWRIIIMADNNRSTVRSPDWLETWWNLLGRFFSWTSTSAYSNAKDSAGLWSKRPDLHHNSTISIIHAYLSPALTPSSATDNYTFVLMQWHRTKSSKVLPGISPIIVFPFCWLMELWFHYPHSRKFCIAVLFSPRIEISDFHDNHDVLYLKPINHINFMFAVVLFFFHYAPIFQQKQLNKHVEFNFCNVLFF